ncbi:MAG: hypothetical protein U0821_18545 [Chloroflexota bacterium]
MGQVDWVAELAKDNPGRKHLDLVVFAGALRAYAEASTHVRKHGAVVAHPRTGEPMENPYLKVQTQQGLLMRKLRGIESARVLALALGKQAR